MLEIRSENPFGCAVHRGVFSSIDSTNTLSRMNVSQLLPFRVTFLCLLVWSIRAKMHPRRTLNWFEPFRNSMSNSRRWLLFTLQQFLEILQLKLVSDVENVETSMEKLKINRFRFAAKNELTAKIIINGEEQFSNKY